MKIPPYIFLVILLFASMTACKEQAATPQKKIPANEAEAAPIKTDQNKQQAPPKLRSIPIEQKSDGRTPMKKKKNALDTLRPKTA